jgi:hypothetical protein
MTWGRTHSRCPQTSHDDQECVPLAPKMPGAEWLVSESADVSVEVSVESTSVGSCWSEEMDRSQGDCRQK